MSYVAWKRGLPRKFARLVLFRLIKKRSFNLLCILNILRSTRKCVYVCVYMLSQFRDLRSMSGLEKQKVLSYACTHLCRRVCLKWRVYMPLGGILFWGWTFGGVYIPCIYSHARWSYLRRFRSLLLCPLSFARYYFPLFVVSFIVCFWNVRRLKNSTTLKICVLYCLNQKRSF